MSNPIVSEKKMSKEENLRRDGENTIDFAKRTGQVVDVPMGLSHEELIKFLGG
jgi:hypothetical protein